MSGVSASGIASARAALAGNPSDGYGGATLAVALPQLRAEVQAERSSGTCFVDPPSDLVQAAIARFARHATREPLSVAVRWRTSIPRSVGLGGSSAIVIATLRALSELEGATLEPLELATTALSVEVEDLGIAAGMQDRLAQSFEGLSFMDFSGGNPYVEELDERLLPPLVIAWRAGGESDSGPVHSDLRVRYERGEWTVRRAMKGLAEHARSARDALLTADLRRFAEAVDLSFDCRRQLMPLDERDVAMVARARGVGAAANYTGSGGAIVAVCRDRAHREHVASALTELGCATIG